MRTVQDWEAGNNYPSADRLRSIEALQAQLELLVAKAAPDLVAVKGIGTDIATILLATAGDNPDRAV